MVHELCALAGTYEQSARIGAARLAPRQRWAILAAAGIYGDIAREVDRLGEHAWDHRAYVSKPRKLLWIAQAGIAAMRKPPRRAHQAAQARPWTRRDFI